MTEEDFAYLRNINTRPGVNAGRSIDPTKPGPDADGNEPNGSAAAEALAEAKARAGSADASGLMEALQQIIDNCDDNSAPQCRHDLALKFVREIALKAHRARAADRSGK